MTVAPDLPTCQASRHGPEPSAGRKRYGIPDPSLIASNPGGAFLLGETTAPAGNHKVTVTANNQTSTENVDFFVQLPAAVNVLSAAPSTTKHPDPLPNGCPRNNVGVFGPFGMSIAVRYQVLDQDSPSKPIVATMRIREDLLDFFVDGQRAGGDLLDAQVTPSDTTEPDGTFLDNGVGACGQGEFALATFRQRLFITLGTSRFDVRSNDFSQSGFYGCGNMGNKADISVVVACP